eukprot:1161560-Pelagomonas_calceolata.AAC.1
MHLPCTHAPLRATRVLVLHARLKNICRLFQHAFLYLLVLEHSPALMSFPNNNAYKLYCEPADGNGHACVHSFL